MISSRRFLVKVLNDFQRPSSLKLCLTTCLETLSVFWGWVGGMGDTGWIVNVELAVVWNAVGRQHVHYSYIKTNSRKNKESGIQGLEKKTNNFFIPRTFMASFITVVFSFRDVAMNKIVLYSHHVVQVSIHARAQSTRMTWWRQQRELTLADYKLAKLRVKAVTSSEKLRSLVLEEGGIFHTWLCTRLPTVCSPARHSDTLFFTGLSCVFTDTLFFMFVNVCQSHTLFFDHLPNQIFANLSSVLFILFDCSTFCKCYKYILLFWVICLAVCFQLVLSHFMIILRNFLISYAKTTTDSRVLQAPYISSACWPLFFENFHMAMPNFRTKNRNYTSIICFTCCGVFARRQ